MQMSVEYLKDIVHLKLRDYVKLSYLHCSEYPSLIGASFIYLNLIKSLSVSTLLVYMLCIRRCDLCIHTATAYVSLGINMGQRDISV